jgi:hypothetical protein
MLPAALLSRYRFDLFTGAFRASRTEAVRQHAEQSEQHARGPPNQSEFRAKNFLRNRLDRLLRRRWLIHHRRRRYPAAEPQSSCQRVEDNAFHLKNDDGIPHADEIFHARGVPVGQANTAVARSTANCLRIIRAVNTDSGFVQAHP